MLKLPREYICNIVYTIVGDPFDAWVASQVEVRNDKIASERDMLVDLDPEIATLFNQSTAVSGRYHTSTSLRVDQEYYSRLGVYFQALTNPFFPYSSEGHQQQPDEARSQEETVEGADRRGEEASRVEGGGDRSEARPV